MELLPIEESFFLKTIFKKKVKLSSQLISLNYNRYAPYKNPLSIFQLEKNNLYIWFYQKEISSKIIIPEVILLFDGLKNNSVNIIKKRNFYNIVVIKENEIINAYTVIVINELLIESELNKYTLKDSVNISETEYQKILQESLNKLNYQDLYRWNQFKINRDEFVPSLVNGVAYPLSFLLFFTMGIHVFHTNQLENEISKLEKIYLEKKEKNSDIKEKIQKESSKEERWKTFIKKELPYVDPLSLYIKIEEAFSSEEITFISLSIVGSKLKVNIKTKENFVLGLNRLNKLKFLYNVSIKNANRKRDSAFYEADIISLGLSL